MKWRADQRAANLRLLAELSVAPAASPTPLPSVIVWPETAVPYLLAAEPRLRQELAALVPQNGYLITGAPRVDPQAPEGAICNSSHALDGNGEIVAPHDKAHLVPFGAYTPLRALPGLATLKVGARDFSDGSGPVSLAMRSEGCPVGKEGAKKC